MQRVPKSLCTRPRDRQGARARASPVTGLKLGPSLGSAKRPEAGPVGEEAWPAQAQKGIARAASKRAPSLARSGAAKRLIAARRRGAG
ncbi:hypothetical protein AcidC75_01830 [Acidisoma sp. C75]